MSASRETIKAWFKRGMKPLESQFAAWIDSFWHKDDTIPIGSVDQLPNILASKADASMVSNAIADAMQNLQVPDASLQQKGVVRLANSLGESDQLAATQSLVNQLANTLADDYYTKSQTEELIDTQIMGLTWKDWVPEYDDLQSVYPSPEVGWLVPVAADSKIYKWNGSAWVDSRLGTIPAGLLKFDTSGSNAPMHDGRELATRDYVDQHIPTIPDASTSQKGLVQLADTLTDDSTRAVTGHAVKQALQDMNLVGEPGPQGPPGPQGLSAFEVWLQQPGNENKSVTDFLNSLRGERGADGAPGPPGQSGLSAYEQWRQLPGNSAKSFDDYLDYLSRRQGFAFNVLFYNITESALSFASPVTITYTAKDANLSSVTYSTDGVSFSNLPIGNTSISIGAGQPLYLRITFASGAFTGTLTIKGDYL